MHHGRQGKTFAGCFDNCKSNLQVYETGSRDSGQQRNTFICGGLKAPQGEKNNNNKKQHTMNNKDLATYFVNGRYGHGSNCQTDGTTFVSYDTAVAANHGNCILIACAYKARNWYGSFFGRTATTERQLLHVKRATTTYFVVPCIFPTDRRDHERNYQYLTTIAEEYRKKAERARTFESVARWNYLQATKLQEARQYWKMFVEA